MDDEGTGFGEKVLVMNRPKGSILDMIAGTTASQAAPLMEETPPPAPPVPVEMPAMGDDDILPSPGDAYQAFARASNRPGITLHVMLKDGSYRGFAYGGFDSIDLLPAPEAGGGPVLCVRFAGIVNREIVIEGTNLGRLHVYLAQHRMPWIREMPDKRGFVDPKAAVISRITVRAVKDSP